MSFKFWLEALEDAGGSLLGFGILILNWILSRVFGAQKLQIVAIYLDLDVVIGPW